MKCDLCGLPTNDRYGTCAECRLALGQIEAEKKAAKEDE